MQRRVVSWGTAVRSEGPICAVEEIWITILCCKQAVVSSAEGGVMAYRMIRLVFSPRRKLT